MRVECVGNKASDLPPDQVDLYGTPETRFDVQIGHTYTVHAMQLQNGVLDLLLCIDHDVPEWNPMTLFRVTDPQIPEHWEYSFANDDETEKNRVTLGNAWGFRPGDTARWGYPEIVHSDEHYLGLIDRQPDDLRIFSRERLRYEEHSGDLSDF